MQYQEEKNKQASETLLSSAPFATGGWKVLHIRVISLHFQEAGLGLESIFLHSGAKGANSPDDKTSHPLTAERVSLSLPGGLELGLKLISHTQLTSHLPSLVPPTALCQGSSNQKLFKEHSSVSGCLLGADSSFISLSCFLAFLFSGSKKEGAFEFCLPELSDVRFRRL